MIKLHQEIAKGFHLLSWGLEEHYYGLSPDPLAVEEALLFPEKLFNQKAFGAIWTPRGWESKYSIYLQGLLLSKLPTVNKTGNSFICSDNKLTTLKGCPSVVPGTFICRCNKLTTLEEGPTKVEGDYICTFNHLVSLQGSPATILGSFLCYENQLETLKGSPLTIKANFNCACNKLESLQHGPMLVEGHYHCSNNRILDTANIPTIVRGEFTSFDQEN